MSATFMIFFRIVTALLITKIAVTNPILHPTTGMTLIEENTQNTNKSIDTAYVIINLSAWIFYFVFKYAEYENQNEKNI